MASLLTLPLLDAENLRMFVMRDADRPTNAGTKGDNNTEQKQNLTLSQNKPNQDGGHLSVCHTRKNAVLGSNHQKPLAKRNEDQTDVTTCVCL